MSTPLKHYSSSDGFTPSTNNRSSTHDFASPQTTLTNYTPELARKPNVDLTSLMSGLGLGTPSRHALDDPFVDHAASGQSFALRATAADYAPTTATTPASVSATHSLSRNSSSPTAAPTVNRTSRKSGVNGAYFISADNTRYVKIVGPLEDEVGMTRIKDVKTMEKSVATKKLDEGGLIFRFDHITDAQVALNTTRSLFSLGSFIPGWSAEFAPAADFHGDHSRDYEGQLKVAITYQGLGQFTEAQLRDIAIAAVQEQAGPTVDILSSKTKSFEADKFVLLMDVQLASVQAAEVLSNKYNHDWKALPGHQDMSIFIEHNCSKFPMSSKPWVSSRSALALRNGHGSPVSPYSPSNAAYMSLNAKDAKVNIAAIENGEDVRTTVMIRNIPNKIDAAMFKTILDEHVFGRYDFSYLRIDFTNNCNVGYAFVNFKNPRDIVTLFKGIVDKPWQVFSSDKIADVCYATNQGLGTCIEKFRNSSVMLEWAPHRPKLWYTIEDGEERAGKEKPFPEPSNLQKLHRSRANANTIGLFPPRGVQVSSLGMSPTRGARGELMGAGYQSPYDQHTLNGTPPMMMSLANSSPVYTNGYGHGSRLAVMSPGAMYNGAQGAANGMGGSPFVSTPPYGYMANGMPPRF